MNGKPWVKFLGAAGCVTGSRFLVGTPSGLVMVDCGLFQGGRDIKDLNWMPLGFPVRELKAVVLTHSHIDHSGFVPRLNVLGYKGNIYATEATADLCSILLPDSGFLQEEEARFVNRRGYSRHQPALPLYTRSEAEAVMRFFRKVPYRRAVEILPGVRVKFIPSGHIVGAAQVYLEIDGPGRTWRLLFSGDLGRYDQQFMDPPVRIPLPEGLDLLCVESTYGDRRHDDVDPSDWLEKHLKDAQKNRRVVLVPAFALGRTQHLLYLIEELERKKRIAPMPVYIDSPMAAEITRLYSRYEEEHNGEIARMLGHSAGVKGWKSLRLTSTVADSKELNEVKGPAVIIAASGMMSGGRILHHLANRLDDPRTKILVVGYQAQGTRGWALLNGAKELKIFGEPVSVKAEIDHLDVFSGHGDQADLIEYVRRLETEPRQTVLVHGEPDALNGLQKALREQTTIRAQIAVLGGRIEL